MAVGDGGNDVPMMKAADVSVGITAPTDDRIDSVNEARLAADFSIRDWRSLEHLILVHGVWNNDRIATVIRFCIYKNVVLHCVAVWYALFTNYTGQVIFDTRDRAFAFYNIFFTSLLPFAIGIFRKIHSAKELCSYPGIYREKGNTTYNSYIGLLKWILAGVVHSLVIFLLSSWSFGNGIIWSTGMEGDMTTMGSSIYLVIIVVVHAKMVGCIMFIIYYSFQFHQRRPH